ncbi:retroviral-like aspartic protease family protein, partial [candidate division WOR-3 bacterium]|nr:retroviral-like aspartic protease family protein [candidate division WOR-3 bacterium]
MNIYGFFRDDIGFIRAHISSSVFEIDENVAFLVDTGASKTVLLDKDALLLNIDYNELRKFNRNLSGIGGSVETYIIDDMVFCFKSDKGKIEFNSPIFVLRHDLEKLSRDERVKILSIPSILGRDIIEKFRLIYDIKMEDLIFTDERIP